MRLILIVFVAVILSSPAYACTQDSDCTLVQDACRTTWIAINRNEQESYEQQLGKRRTLIECNSPNPSLVKPAGASCINHGCQVR